MFSFITKLFKGKETPVPKNIDDDHLREIISNRYPPYDEGFVISSGEDLLAQHQYLVGRIRYICGLSDADFERLYIPLLTNYAEFVQLLPASQKHHHKGAGGLLRHGLEVGHYSLESSFFKLFSGKDKTEDKRVNEPRWRYASFVAGLLHDVGKPVSDLEVIDKDGTNKWNPYESTITQWSNKHNLKRYYIRWNRKRVHKDHEVFAGMVSNMIIPVQCLEYISEGGVEISSAMFKSIGGVDDPYEDSLLASVVKKADSYSTKNDLQENGDITSVSGTPVERHIIDAIRELVDSNKHWIPNDPGSRLWKTDEGLFVIWVSAVDDIKTLLRQNDVPGIPQNKNTLAEILIDHGYAEKFILSDGTEKTYWSGSKEFKGIQKTFSLLKLARVSSIIEHINDIENSDMVINTGTEDKEEGGSVNDNNTQAVDKTNTESKPSVDNSQPTTDTIGFTKNTDNNPPEFNTSLSTQEEIDSSLEAEFNKSLEDDSEDFNYSSEQQKNVHSWLLSKGKAGVTLDSVLNTILEDDDYKLGTNGSMISEGQLCFSTNSDIFKYSGTNLSEFKKLLTNVDFLKNGGAEEQGDQGNFICLNDEISIKALQYLGVNTAEKTTKPKQQEPKVSLLVLLRKMLLENDLTLMDLVLFENNIFYIGDKVNFVAKISSKNSDLTRKDIRVLISQNFSKEVDIVNPINGKTVKAGKYEGSFDLREIKNILKNKMERANG